MSDERGGLRVTSFAKINRELRVLGKRPDGFHELDTVFQTVDLTETLDLLEEEEGGGEVSLTIEGADLPADGSNLVLRAAAALRERFNVRRGARIHLSKKIPVGGGLGGGSSNAAAALRGLTTLWDLPLGKRTLHAVAASLGSDVPFFLLGGRARGQGRGEVLTPLPDGPEEWVLLVFPPFSLSTAEVYGRLPARALTGSPSATKVSGSETGGGPERNDLEQAAESLRGELRRIRSALAGSGARSARLSGSGSTVFGTFGTKDEAAKARESLEGLGNETKAKMTIVKTVSRAEFARRATPVRLAQRG
ncbi:MAG: 4-(cytidine 5'-diphospho)-2-C-methyl-D-erythritol kinase [Thermoanaerobaculia bacterium]